MVGYGVRVLVDVCSAVHKRGARTLICEEQLGHLTSGLPHRMGDETWDEPTWAQDGQMRW